MKKNFALFCFFISIFNIACSANDKKQKKIVELFELVNDKQSLKNAWEPIFVSVNITDQKAKDNALSRYFENVKKDFVVAYDKFFDEKDIDEMLKYNRSETGKKFNSLTGEINKELSKAYSSMMNIVQEIMPKAETQPSPATSKAIIHFEELAKNKSGNEAIDLFNKEIKHAGLTIVKFSAVWCGPCQKYAPDFEKVASELKEIMVNDKKLPIKYIALDVDASKEVAQNYSVISIPTTIFFKNGQKIDSQTGYISPHALTSKIKDLAAK